MDSEADQHLLRQIAAAFESVPRNEGLTLLQARMLDDLPQLQILARKKDRESRRQMRAIDEQAQRDREDRMEQRWQDIPLSEIRRFSDAFMWLDLEGSYFYLPAFMFHCVSSVPNWSEFDHLSSTLVRWLMPNRCNHDLLEALKAKLTNEQRQALADTLQHIFFRNQECWNRDVSSFWKF